MNMHYQIILTINGDKNPVLCVTCCSDCFKESTDFVCSQQQQITSLGRHSVVTIETFTPVDLNHLDPLTKV